LRCHVVDNSLVLGLKLVIMQTPATVVENVLVEQARSHQAVTLPLARGLANSILRVAAKSLATGNFEQTKRWGV
jgi:hypothetical protein